MVLWAVYPPASPVLEAWADQELITQMNNDKLSIGAKQLTNTKREKQEQIGDQINLQASKHKDRRIDRNRERKFTIKNDNNSLKLVCLHLR